VTNYDLGLIYSTRKSWLKPKKLTHGIKKCLYTIQGGSGSSVGIATGYGLDGPEIESRWGRDFPHLSRPALGSHPASCTMGTGSFPGVKSGRVVTLIPHSFLVPWSRKSRAMLLLPLWAVRPVQCLSACTSVHFTFTYFIQYKSMLQYFRGP